jgi:hypothetical protein
MDGTRDLLESFYIDFNDRDVEAMLEAMHADVDWPNDWEGGRLQGRDAVRDYWRRQWAVIDPHLTPLVFSPGLDGGWAVEAQLIVQDRAGQVLDDRVVVHVYAFEDGLIRSMWIER